jgi:hypothetical protein
MTRAETKKWSLEKTNFSFNFEGLKLEDLLDVNGNIKPEKFAKLTLEQRSQINLLKAIYDGIYTTTFPKEEEREPLASWLEALSSNDNNPQQFINAHFANKERAQELANQIASERDGTKRAKLQTEFTSLTIGFVVSEHYGDDKNNEEDNRIEKLPTPTSALINYVIRNQDFTGGDYPANLMVDHQLKQLSNHAETRGERMIAAFWEANIPERVKYVKKDGSVDTNEDVMHPQRRLQCLEETYGAKNLNFKWVQPPLDVDQGMCDALYLYSYPVPDLDPPATKEEIIDALKEYVNKFYETFPVEGKFSDKTKGGAAQQFAEFSKKMQAELFRFSQSIKHEKPKFSPEFLTENQEALAKIEAEFKKMAFAKASEEIFGSDDLEALNKFAKSLGFKNESQRADILAYAAQNASESFKAMSEAVNEMNAGLLALTAENLYTENKFNKESYEQDKIKMEEYKRTKEEGGRKELAQLREFVIDNSNSDKSAGTRNREFSGEIDVTEFFKEGGKGKFFLKSVSFNEDGSLSAVIDESRGLFVKRRNLPEQTFGGEVAKKFLQAVEGGIIESAINKKLSKAHAKKEIREALKKTTEITTPDSENSGTSPKTAPKNPRAEALKSLGLKLPSRVI